MVICEKTQCTGCEACRSVCPRQCITMVEDNEGFLSPQIDEAACTQCNRCTATCPVLKGPKLDRSATPVAYACWHKDTAVRLRSSSGGAFSALAEDVIARDGIVFGAAYDGNLRVHHTGIDSMSSLDSLRRSKYVQSEIRETYREVERQLSAGRDVLFVGTPCQVAGLYAFLGNSPKTLTTCDLICHGVPSPKVFAKYLHWIERCIGGAISEINFRDKRKGWDDPVTVVYDTVGHNAVLRGKYNSYFNGFNKDAFLRESCYSCKFNGLPRYGDLTIGDFWGIGRRSPFAQNRERKDGISVILVNNDHGTAFLTSCGERLILVKRDLQEVASGNSLLHTSSRRPSCRDGFYRDLDQYDFDVLAWKYLRPSFKARVRILAREHLNGYALQLLRRLYGMVRK